MGQKRKGRNGIGSTYYGVIAELKHPGLIQTANRNVHRAAPVEYGTKKSKEEKGDELMDETYMTRQLKAMAGASALEEIAHLMACFDEGDMVTDRYGDEVNANRVVVYTITLICAEKSGDNDAEGGA